MVRLMCRMKSVLFLWQFGNITVLSMRLFIAITALRRKKLKWLNIIQKKKPRKLWDCLETSMQNIKVSFVFRQMKNWRLHGSYISLRIRAERHGR
nr:MAG TPA: hypothetical protein [Bacteriophage sp.]